MNSHRAERPFGMPERKGQPSDGLVRAAQKAIEYLIDHDGFVECTKQQFGLIMGWHFRDGNRDKGNERYVQDVCNVTRDQDKWPEVAEALGGYVVSYAPNKGGLSLVDPTGELPLEHLVHILVGDIQKQQGIKTTNRRRLPTWKALGSSAFNAGDQELSRLAFQAEQDIDSTGFVGESLVVALHKVVASRGYGA